MIQKYIAKLKDSKRLIIALQLFADTCWYNANEKK